MDPNNLPTATSGADHGYLTTYAPLMVSLFSLGVSSLTAWITLLKQGRVKMTRPAGIYFGPDGGIRNADKPKVFLRTLVYCTAKSGRVVESMYVSLTRNESKQNFSFWVEGEEKLSRGSGMFVGQEGVLRNHHFLAPDDSNNFRFLAGTYRLEVFAKVVGNLRTTKLFDEKLLVSEGAANALSQGGKGLHFDWGPDAQQYYSHIEEGPLRRPEKHSPYEIDWEKLAPG